MHIVIWERKCCILPKFVPHTYPEKKMQVLWLRYLAETDWQTRDVPVELLENPKIRKAVSILEASAFTPAQLEGCEKFWDMIGVKKSIYDCAEEKGRAEGRIEGELKGKQETARNLKALGIDVGIIVKASGLSVQEVEGL